MLKIFSVLITILLKANLVPATSSTCSTTCSSTNGVIDYTKYYNYDGCCNHDKNDPNSGRINFDNAMIIGEEGQYYCSTTTAPYACSTSDGYPAARQVTNTISRQALEYKADFGLNVMHVQFGQWINHELNQPTRGACSNCPTVTNKIVDLVNDPICYWNTCNRCALIQTPSLCTSCFTEPIPDYCEGLGITDDCRANPYYSTYATCSTLGTSFTLTAPAANGVWSGTNFLNGNGQTGLLDLDSIYGTSKAVNTLIRTFGAGGKTGQLITGSYPLVKSVGYFEYALADTTVTIDNVLPSRATVNVTAQPGSPDKFPSELDWYTPKAPNLDVLSAGLISVTFVREHNRLATEIATANPSLSDEEVFQKARRLNIAVFQHIVFDEWIPTLFGPDGYDEYIGDYDGYDSEVPPQIENKIVHAALRYGHMMFDDWIPVNECGVKQSFITAIERRDNINQLTLLTDTMLEFGYDNVDQAINAHFRGLIATNAKRLDPTVSDRIRNFAGSANVNVDLFSADISRNRLHGIPPYLLTRKALLDDLPNSCEKVIDYEINHQGSANQYQKQRAKCLNAITRNNTETIVFNGQSLAARLDSLYTDLTKIDFSVGLGSEYPAYETSNIGKTLLHSLGTQFYNLRAADRLWYERHNLFTSSELEWIKDRTFGDLLVDNFGFEDTFRDNVFIKPPEFDVWIQQEVCVV